MQTKITISHKAMVSGVWGLIMFWEEPLYMAMTSLLKAGFGDDMAHDRSSRGLG